MKQEEIFDRVYDFHGHICLMSTAGVRLALSAMDAIKAVKGEEYLFAFYHAKTCAIDAVQYITNCTLGNGNIVVTDDREHKLELVRQSDGEGVSVTLKEGIRDKMKKCMRLKRESGKEGNEALKEKSDAEFDEVLNMLRDEDESLIVSVTPFTIDIKPYLRF